MAIYQTKIERKPLEKKTLKSKIVAVSICLDQPPPRQALVSYQRIKFWYIDFWLNKWLKKLPFYNQNQRINHCLLLTQLICELVPWNKNNKFNNTWWSMTSDKLSFSIYKALINKIYSNSSVFHWTDMTVAYFSAKFWKYKFDVIKPK